MNIILINQAITHTFDNVGSMEGFEYSANRLVIEDMPGRVGAQYIAGLWGRRRLSWQSIFTSQQNRSDIIRVCQVGNLKTLKLTTCDNRDLQIGIEIEKITMPYKLTRGMVQVEAVAPDPRFFSQTEYLTNTIITSIGGGTPIPTPIPMNMGNIGTPLPVISNQGNMSTPPIFVIHGPGTDFYIKNVTTGEQIFMDVTLLSNEYITIDTKEKTIIKGTNTNVFGLFSGDFFDLDSGNTQIYFNVISGNTASTSLDIKYRYAYGGI